MRIAVLTTSFPRWPGDLFGTFVLGLCRALARASHDLVVVCPQDARPIRDAALEGLPVRRFNYILPPRWQTLCYGAGIPANIRQRPASIVEMPFLVAGFVRAAAPIVESCDLVHAHWTVAGLAALILRRRYRKPVVLHMHGAEVYTRGVAPFVRPILNRADHVICNSAATAGAIRSMATPSAVSVIPFGVNEECVLTSADRSDLRRALQLPGETRIVSFLGRLVKRKGVDDLLVACSKLVSRGEPVHLVVGGTGPQQGEWESLMTRLRLDSHVTFLGLVPPDQVARLYAGSDVFVLPAVVDGMGDTEGLGVVLLEAMANGVPTVATRVGGISDVVLDGVTGFLVEPGDPAQLAEKIHVLLRDSVLRNQMGRAAAARVRQVFAWPSIVERTIEVYRNVLTEHP